MKPLFDVCLIAKNEAKTLPRLMVSLQEFRDRGGRVNVCDTGSTDGTPEVARLFGAVVKEVGPIYVHEIGEEEAKAINDRFIVENEIPVVFPGEKYFDFASARNDSVSMAESDWICTVDADEVLTKMDIDKINEIIASDPNLAHFEYNFVFSHTWDGKELIKFVQSKFYNRKKMEWRGIIHEILTPTEGGGRYFLGEEIFKLEHWQNEESNRTGYLRGLAVDCFENQDKDRNSHYFAREMWWNGRPWSAAKEFKRHIEMNGWPAERAESMLFLGDIYGAMGHPEEQLEWFHKAIDTEPNRREGLIKLAQTHMRRGEWIPANFYATAALELPWYPFYGADKRFYTNEPHEILYRAKGWLGDIEGARKHLLICLDYQREHPEYLRDTQYYFDYAANNIPGWMSFKEQLFLYRAAKQMESVIECGSWKGKSTYAICKSGCPDVTAIDHWKGSKAEPEAHAEAASGTVFKQFKANLKDFPDLKIINKDINDAVLDVPDHSVDMIFIDAGHTYEEVVNDIRKWKNKARILLCGHDYVSGWPGVMQAVDEELGGPDEVHDTIWVKWLVNPLVSIVIPTMDRPEKLHRLLESIKANAGYENIEIVVGADEPRPNNIGAPKMVKKLTDKSKGELVMFLGNDCVMKPNCVREAVWEMARRFPDMDGMVGLNDEYWPKDHVAPHWLASKKLLPYLGGAFFDTDFFHTGVDNILLGRCEKIGKYTWAEKAKIWHDHPMFDGTKYDAGYIEAYSGPRHDHDDKLYHIKMKEYGLDEKRFQ